MKFRCTIYTTVWFSSAGDTKCEEPIGLGNPD